MVRFLYVPPSPHSIIGAIYVESCNSRKVNDFLLLSFNVRILKDVLKSHLFDGLEEWFMFQVSPLHKSS